MSDKPREFEYVDKLSMVIKVGPVVMKTVGFNPRLALIEKSAYDKLKKIIAKCPNENDDLGAEYVHVKILKAENEKLIETLEKVENMECGNCCRSDVYVSSVVRETLDSMSERCEGCSKYYLCRKCRKRKK